MRQSRGSQRDKLGFTGTDLEFLGRPKSDNNPPRVFAGKVDMMLAIIDGGALEGS